MSIHQEDQIVPAVPAVPAVSSTNYFAWTDEKKYTLAKLVNKNAGHKKTEISFKVKFDIILSQIITKPGFEDLKILPMALQNKFKADKDAVLLKFGISKDDVNLSGMDGTEPTDYEKLILDMAEAEYKETRKRKQKTQITMQRKKVNAGITQEGLNRQGERSVGAELIEVAAIANASPASNSDGSSSATSFTNTNHSSGSNFGRASRHNQSVDLIETLSKTIADSIAASSSTKISEEDKELEREVKRAQIAASKAQEMYFLRMANNANPTSHFF